MTKADSSTHTQHVAKEETVVSGAPLSVTKATTLSNWHGSMFSGTMELQSVKNQLGGFFAVENEAANRWWKHFIAGGLAGAVSRTATAPLDRLKVLLQLQQPGMYRPISQVFREIIHDGGVTALWRGNGVNVLKIAPETALKFVFFDQAKQMLMKWRNHEKVTTLDRFISAASAGALSQTIIYPLEVVKTRLTSAKTGQFRGLIHCAYILKTSNGFPVFYRGFTTNLLGIIPYAGIDLTVYESLKLWMIENQANHEPDTISLLICGAISSSCGQLASYPLALIRTRLQMKDQHHSMLLEFRDIIRDGGIRALYRGFAPNFMKVAPAVSISYVVYENVKSFLGISKFVV